MPAGSSAPHESASATRMILVTGAPRSGTSTVAGTLHYLGFHVPEPVLKGNESNPRGFFESWWPVRFHNRILDAAMAEKTDGRPDAHKLIRSAVDDGHRAELRAWLTEVADSGDRIVVKDPRAVWVPWLWVDTATTLGMEISFLTMLRHPTEVLGSRQTYYADNRPHMAKWEFAVWNLCGWINQNLLIEQETRAQRRTFVPYTDLLADWRTSMRRVRSDLDATFDDDLDPGHHHEVDDFIDSGLRRHDLDWSDWDMPAELVEIAEATYSGLTRLGELGGHDEATEKELDDAFARYTALYQQSAAIAQDVATARAKQAKAEGASEVREKIEKKAERRAQKAAQAASTAPAPAAPSGARALAVKLLDRYPALRRGRERLRRS